MRTLIKYLTNQENSMTSTFDYLDAIAMQVIAGDATHTGVLSTGERLYVALSANSAALLKEAGYTIVEAIMRLDTDWRKELIRRWQYPDRHS
jgi:hypothetical protein